MRLVPSHNGKAELKRPPGEGPGIVRTSFGVARVCAGPAHAGVRQRRLRVLDVGVGVDDDEVAAEIRVGVLAHEREDAAVLHLARAARTGWRCVVRAGAWLLAP